MEEPIYAAVRNAEFDLAAGLLVALARQDLERAQGLCMALVGDYEGVEEALLAALGERSEGKKLAEWFEDELNQGYGR